MRVMISNKEMRAIRGVEARPKNLLTNAQSYKKGDANMDKQTNILSNTNNAIPVNTRTIGTPEGIYILYLEDYVHTFIKKVLEDKNSNTISLGTDAEYQIEKDLQTNIALYGRCVEENGRYRLVISGAAVIENNINKAQQCKDTCFPSCDYIGMARVSHNKDARLRLELTLSNTTVILDDFYIYYDQNDEMQNYLIEWNASKEKSGEKEKTSAAEQGMRIRNHVDDAAQLGRIAQAYNREEAKVSFMWNVMNVLCLGFVVCIMACGISTVNNYSKMQNMQEKIDYCMAFIEENTSFNLQKADDTQTVTAMQPSILQNDTETSSIQQNTQTTGEGTTLETANSQIMNQAATNSEMTNTIDSDSTITNAETANTDNPNTANQQTADTPDTPADVTTNPETANTQITNSETTSVADINGETANQETANTAQSPAEQQDTQNASQPASNDIQPQTNAQQEQPKQYYIVRKGDTLRTICYEIYGDYAHVEEICEWNHIEDPDSILYGQKLLLP